MSNEYFLNPPKYDGRDPLPPFSLDEWADGFTIERYKQDGYGVKNKKGQEIKLGVIKFHSKKKDVSKASVIRATHDWLSDTCNRTVDECREYVEDYANTYRKGYDPLSFTSLKDIKSFEFYMEKKDENGKFIGIAEKKVPKTLDELEISQRAQMSEVDDYGTKRNQVAPDPEVMKMLIKKIFTPYIIKRIQVLRDED
jgi:hypothetical protein